MLIVGDGETAQDGPLRLVSFTKQNQIEIPFLFELRLIIQQALNLKRYGML